MENTMSICKAAKLLGITVKTLQRWEREGRLIPVAHTPTNHRFSTESQLRAFIGLRHAGSEPTGVIAYCRVSSATQKPDGIAKLPKEAQRSARAG
jgi:predicted site-specific integrase-resolvase